MKGGISIHAWRSLTRIQGKTEKESGKRGQLERTRMVQGVELYFPTHWVAKQDNMFLMRPVQMCIDMYYEHKISTDA